MKKFWIILFVFILLAITGSAFFILGSQYNNDNSEITTQTRTSLTNSEIISMIKPATVYIETDGGTGSGMIFDSSGYIMTNAHVVSDTNTAKIKTADGQLYSATVTGRDEIIDIAILKISGKNFPIVTFGDSDTLKQGDDVFTLGYPFGLEGDVSFKEGTISRRITEGDITYLETSAQIHPGNSGGPLANVFGEVVGINSAGFGDLIEGIFIGETIKFALPINHVKGLLTDLKDGREILIEKEQEETAPEPPKPVATSPAPTPITKGIELSENPSHLFSAGFNPNTVKIYGAGIGDVEKSIPESIRTDFGLEIYRYGVNGNDTVSTIHDVSYKILNGKVAEIRLGMTATKNLFGMLDEDDVLTKLGKPDVLKSNTKSGFGDIYIYSDKSLVIEVNPVFIAVSILSK